MDAASGRYSQACRSRLEDNLGPNGAEILGLIAEDDKFADAAGKAVQAAFEECEERSSTLSAARLGQGLG